MLAMRFLVIFITHTEMRQFPELLFWTSKIDDHKNWSGVQK